MESENDVSEVDKQQTIRIGTRKTEFLSRFRLDNRALQRGDAKSGKAKIIGGTNRESGERVVLKHWRRDASGGDAALKEIWRQEIRQLHRLAGCPGAREYMITQLDSGEDEDGFYLVLDPGQRLPIEALKDRLAEYHWIHQSKLPINRMKIWANLTRVASGLDILHSQGMLHRNLDLWSVFSSGSEEPDFQLSGFEWSVRLAGVANTAASRVKANTVEGIVYSFLEDWRDFSRLACSLLGVDPRVFLHKKQRDVLTDTVQHLAPLERELLSACLRSDPLTRLDGDWVSQKISDIVQSLKTLASGKLSTLHLTCNFSTGRLGSAIYDAVLGDIDLHDKDALIEFIRRDISDEPLLIATSTIISPGVRYLLAGRNLTYSINPYRPVQRGDPTWAIAYCEAVTSRPTQREIVGQQLLSFAEIQVIPLNQASKRLSTLQGRALYWDQQVTMSEVVDSDEPIYKKFQGFVLLQQLEALVSAANIFPIYVVAVEHLTEQIRLSVKARVDPQRDNLATALALKSPALRMAEIFADEQLSPDGTWKISEAGVLGNYDDETAKWRFVETIEEDGATTVIFEGPGPEPTSTHLFLRKDDYVGNEALLRRRTRSLRTLKDHIELLEMLTNPRKQVRKTHEALEEDEYFLHLDKSKQDALKEMWAVLPLFLVQGPPGVGKTRLVTELVRRTLAGDDSTRLLLTAQSHHAVDHLLDEVRKIIPKNAPGENAPLLIRTRPRDNDANEDDLDVKQQARLILTRFTESQLAKAAPKKLRQKIVDLQRLYSTKDVDNQVLQRSRDRSFEALLLRSANVVFASTNSGDLERLIEERVQFDWTIVEEAAKATGVEILAPLLLSHRRLMIGDHDQLPPYGEEQMRRLLAQPNKVRDALDLARPMISTQLRDSSVEDLSSAVEPEQFAALCGEAATILNLFESFVKNEFDTNRSGKNRLVIARRLTYQHRMHPAIATLVSNSFYDGDLKTDAGCASEFESARRPFDVVDQERLPDSPVIFIDMPYRQTTPNSPTAERKPNYHNPDELEAVINVLAQLRLPPDSIKTPSIAVLSPYRQQVKRLSAKIKKEMNGKLQALNKFVIEGEGESLAGTVDSFQGSEADIVVLSLVRNNHHSGKRALGFLSDSRRMNVLLSRAKWKLIVVCSTAFLRRRLPSKHISKSDDLYFLSQMFETLDKLCEEKDSLGRPLACIIDVAKINGEVR
ncbi:AAA domain-containing protein [Oxalobacteraceae bacterium OTU3REALA1]|nr:AAA domain-containing protein [Oxalobacteraceae bacterium OTU3REALA1]